MSNTKKALTYGFLGLAAIAYLFAGYAVANHIDDYHSKSTFALFISIVSIVTASGISVSIKGSSMKAQDYISLLVILISVALMLMANNQDWGLLAQGLILTIAIITGYQLVLESS